jgi:nucleotide-binding universal stress UspA family protein
MAFKSIVAVATGASGDEIALSCAAVLAARESAHVEVIPAFPDPAADLIYYGATLSHVEAVAREKLAAAEKEAQGRVEALARTAASANGLAWGDAAPGMSVAARSLAPAVALAEAALLADLAVISGEAVRGSVALSNLFAETLLTTRAPVFVAKAAVPDLSAAAIAWDGSAGAARAVRAALPMLEKCARIVSISNVDDDEIDGAKISTTRLETFLKRHGVIAPQHHRVSGGDVAASLLSAAREAGCGVLVAGGYGRPRLFEFVLGGATRSLVRAEGPPSLLLAH